MRILALTSVAIVVALSTFAVNAQHDNHQHGEPSNNKTTASTAKPVAMTSNVFQRQTIQVNKAEYAHVIDDMQKMLNSVQGITGALAVQDWNTVKQLSFALSPQAEAADKDPADISFHNKLPAGWRELGGPMKKGFGALAEEASNGKRTDIALKLLSTSLTQCVACHSTFALKVNP
jgi:hypothetical protein